MRRADEHKYSSVNLFFKQVTPNIVQYEVYFTWS